jgi:hypothetical protein
MKAKLKYDHKLEKVEIDGYFPPILFHKGVEYEVVGIRKSKGWDSSEVVIVMNEEGDSMSVANHKNYVELIEEDNQPKPQYSKTAKKTFYEFKNLLNALYMSNPLMSGEQVIEKIGYTLDSVGLNICRLMAWDDEEFLHVVVDYLIGIGSFEDLVNNVEGIDEAINKLRYEGIGYIYTNKQGE